MNSLGNRFLWVFTFIFRQKNKRTKEQKSLLNTQMFVQASLTCICSFNAVHYGAVSTTYFCWIRTKEVDAYEF